ncbi:phage tail protein [Kribbella sp. NBC_01505]|uniref:phage tail protein n=1 Tax=Kribbella sp. NBC_01505 TaxID=2903580 RepID=UPI003864D514
MSIPGLPTAGPAVVGAAGRLFLSPRSVLVPSASPYGMTMWFDVSVARLDGLVRPLGLWSGCSGLEVQLVPEGPLDEGGNYTVPRYLPGKLTYGKVTLERAMTQEGAGAVQSWLEEQSAQWVEGQDDRQPWSTTVSIRLHRSVSGEDSMIHEWVLENAMAASWTVPAFNTKGGGIALEKLTLVHGGFLKTGALVSKLELVEDGHGALTFLCNPSKISLKKQRRVEAKNATVDTGVEVVDPNAMGITLSDLRIEGAKEVGMALPRLERWLQLEPPAAAKPKVAPPPAEGTNPKTCSLCQQVQPVPAAAASEGEPHVLRPSWGLRRGGLPPQVILKSFDLVYTRFTPGGEPSRATVSLTLQEYTRWKVGKVKDPARPPSSAVRIGASRPLGRRP